MTKNRTFMFAMFFLYSCGGGGGGGSETTPTVSVAPTPPAQPATPTFEELRRDFEGYYEYRSHWGLKSINSSSAHARGATGSGVTIGITDSGLDVTHLEIDSARISPNSDLEYSDYIPNTRQKRHGTMVTSIAAGGLDKIARSPMHGVAFDATVLFIAIQLAEPDPDYDPIDLGDTDSSGDLTNAPDVAEQFAGIDSFFSSLFDIYNFYDVDIVNNSYGFSGNIIDYTEAQVRNAFPKTIAEMSQLGTPDENKTIYVWAAEMQAVMQIRVLIIQVQNYYLAWHILLKKFRVILLLWYRLTKMDKLVIFQADVESQKAIVLLLQEEVLMLHIQLHQTILEFTQTTKQMLITTIV